MQILKGLFSPYAFKSRLQEEMRTNRFQCPIWNHWVSFPIHQPLALWGGRSRQPQTRSISIERPGNETQRSAILQIGCLTETSTSSKDFCSSCQQLCGDSDEQRVSTSACYIKMKQNIADTNSVVLRLRYDLELEWYDPQSQGPISSTVRLNGEQDSTVSHNVIPSL